jgi:hypothetical protein
MNDSGKQHDADRLDALVREFTGDYNEPPGDLDERSREEIFQRVQRVRGRHRRAPAPRPHRRLWMQAAGIAAVLLVGIAIGRWDPPARPGNGDGPVATNGTEELSRRSVYRFAARAYLERTENLLLTLERAAYSPEPSTPWGTATAEPTVRWAHDLLRETRLLQDSPAAQDDVQLSQLLDDLELLLARIVQAASGDDELDPSPITDPTVLQRVRGEIERSSVTNEI